jgi:hypothetical protein
LNMIIDKSSLAVNMKASGCFLMVYKRCWNSIVNSQYIARPSSKNSWSIKRYQARCVSSMLHESHSTAHPVLNHWA